MNLQFNLKTSLKLIKYLLLTVLISACSSKSEIDDDLVENISLLSQHPWQLQKVYINNIERELALEDIPFIAIFNANGILRAANFTEVWEEEWSFEGSQFSIEEEQITIKSLTNDMLVLADEQNGQTVEFSYVACEYKESFPIENFINNTFYVSEIQPSVESQADLFSIRSRILIEDMVMTFTEEELNRKEWEIISDSFFFIYTDMNEGEGFGFSISVKDDESFKATYLGEDDERIYTFKQCGLLNYLCGPHWTLQRVEKDGVETDLFPLPNGSVWYFNRTAMLIEEQLPGESELNEMLWELVSNNPDQGLKVSIQLDEAEPNVMQEFIMLKGTIDELELGTRMDGNDFLLSFKVEDEE